METTETKTQPDQRGWLVSCLPNRRVLGVILCVYWVSMFLGTHVDIEPPGPDLPDSDKVMHFLGYCGLATLLSLWVAFSTRLTLRTVVAILLTIGVYGAIDELLQIPVGRNCDAWDWVADMLGASLGVSLVTLFTRLNTNSTSA